MEDTEGRTGAKPEAVEDFDPFDCIRWMHLFKRMPCSAHSVSELRVLCVLFDLAFGIQQPLR